MPLRFKDRGPVTHDDDGDVIVVSASSPESQECIRLRENAKKAAQVEPAKKKINGHSNFVFEWQRAFSAVEDTSAKTGLPSTTRLVLWTVSRFMDRDGTGA